MVSTWQKKAREREEESFVITDLVLTAYRLNPIVKEGRGERKGKMINGKGLPGNGHHFMLKLHERIISAQKNEQFLPDLYLFSLIIM